MSLDPRAGCELVEPDSAAAKVVVLAGGLAPVVEAHLNELPLMLVHVWSERLASERGHCQGVVS